MPLSKHQTRICVLHTPGLIYSPPFRIPESANIFRSEDTYVWISCAHEILSEHALEERAHSMTTYESPLVTVFANIEDSIVHVQMLPLKG